MIFTPPLTTTRAEEIYAYQLGAYDPDGDPLAYALVSAPQGMTISASGRVEWRPHVIGAYTVEIAVTDSHAAQTTQEFTLQVLPPITLNEAPEITSTPPTPAIRDREYVYQVTADDPNGDTLTYSLDAATIALGATINSATGLLEWTPMQAGNVTLRVNVSDGSLTVGQLFTISVLENAPPVITSSPVTSAEITELYTYEVNADDPNAGDDLTFSLTQAPAGMTIDPETGVISWTPSTVGPAAVTVKVTDPDGAFATQSFSIAVIDPSNNASPTITSTPRDSVGLGQTFTYQFVATDADGDPLAFELVSGPAGMSITSAGLLLWTPGPGDVNAPETPHEYTIRVEDGRTGYDEETFEIHVLLAPVNDAPEITSTPSRSATVGYLYQYDANATDIEGDQLFWSLESTIPGMTINAQSGVVSWTPTPSQIGDYEVRVRVTDIYSASEFQVFTVTARGANALQMSVEWLSSHISMFVSGILRGLAAAMGATLTAAVGPAGQFVERAIERGEFDLYLLRARHYGKGDFRLRGFRLLNVTMPNGSAIARTESCPGTEK